MYACYVSLHSLEYLSYDISRVKEHGIVHSNYSGLVDVLNRTASTPTENIVRQPTVNFVENVLFA